MIVGREYLYVFVLFCDILFLDLMSLVGHLDGVDGRIPAGMIVRYFHAGPLVQREFGCCFTCKNIMTDIKRIS